MSKRWFFAKADLIFMTWAQYFHLSVLLSRKSSGWEGQSLCSARRQTKILVSTTLNRDRCLLFFPSLWWNLSIDKVFSVCWALPEHLSPFSCKNDFRNFITEANQQKSRFIFQPWLRSNFLQGLLNLYFTEHFILTLYW